MNKVLSAILKSAESIAVQTVPGAGIVDASVKAVISAKDSGSKIDAALDAAEGAIQAAESISGVQIADELKFREGAALVEAGIKQMHEAIAAPVDSTPSPAPKQ